jgi:hypothetical protein
VKARAKLQSADPERAKPKGVSGDCRTNPAAVARDSRKGESPEAAARWAAQALRRREYRREKRRVGSSSRKRVDTFREEKAPKGESQERRRHEKRPARARRE